MIVKMLKAYVVVRAEEKERLLTALRDAGVVHLEAVNPGKAAADEKSASAISRLARAEQILSTVAPEGEPPQLDALGAADRTLALFSQAAEQRARLASLHREAESLSMWGDLRLEQVRHLNHAGVEVRFALVPADEVEKITAQAVEVIETLPGRRRLVAVADWLAMPSALPESAQVLELPPRDRGAVLAEAAQLDQTMRDEAAELARLAKLRSDIRDERRRLQRHAAFVLAGRGGVEDEALFGVQGWVPATQARTLEQELSIRGVAAAVELRQPQADELPPTLIDYPVWAKPVSGLFAMLGAVPGYTEFDVSGAFMLAMPVFSAMLIADACYGLVFVLLGAMLYGKMARQGKAALPQMIIAIGVVSVVWGVMLGSYFSIEPWQIQQAGPAGGLMWTLGSALGHLDIVPNDAAEMFRFMAQLVFIIGAVHMSAAHLWQAVGLAPDLRAIAHVGWAIFLWGMLFVVDQLVLNIPIPLFAKWLLIVGGAMAILFAAPSRNPAKMLGLGLANFPLSAIGTLGDTISYIRLMAIGMAGGALGLQFNSMIYSVAQSIGWLGAVPLLAVAHGMNIALAIIALFAHAVRLNMLEFSNHIGMAWSGYPYEPFSNSLPQES